jgi:hypothetical protein
LKRITTFFVIVLLSFVIVFSQTPEELLLEENEISGWVFDTDSICNEGTADDAQGLYAIIDGGANTYTDRGFVAGAFDGYTDGSYKMCIEIYDQGFKDSALSVYMATYDGEYKPITAAGDSARLDTVPLFNFEIEMIVDKFFVRISSVDTKEETYVQAATAMAQHIAGEVGIIEKPVFQNISPVNLITVSYTKNIYLFTIKGKNLSKEKNKIPEASIFNNKGQIIRNVPLQSVEKGFKAAWDGNNKAGQQVAKGQYTIVIRSDKGLMSKSFTKDK